MANLRAPWAWIGLLALCAESGVPRASEALRADGYASDFDTFWHFVHDEYAYFDRAHVDWDGVGEHYSSRARGARDRTEFLSVLEGALAELYDDHAHLGSNTQESFRLVPSGTDLWAEWQGDRAVLTAVRSGSAAERAGLRAGMHVRTVAGVPVEQAVAARLPTQLKGPDGAARDWALRSVLAGRHGEPVRLELGGPGGERSVEFRPGLERPEGVLSWKRIDEFGYVRVHDSLGETDLIAAFDGAVASLRTTTGMVLDLRDTPSGGNTSVARGLLGRFVPRTVPYQRHEYVAEERRLGVRRSWIEEVSPRGPFRYAGPVVVLVGRWTGSMGEGLAIGMHGTGVARVIGTPMAGLLGAIEERALPATGIVVRIPTQKLFHVNGTPREAFRPEPFVPSATDGDPDACLAAGLALLRGAGD